MSNRVSSIVTSTAAARKDANMGRLLIEQGKLTLEQVDSVRRLQKEDDLRFGEAAKRLGFISESDIEQALSRQFDYPYLQQGQGNYPSMLRAAYEPFSAEVEALRSVRSQLMLRWFGAGHKSLAIAGINSGDGTSLLAANLAVVFSQLGEQTLLVDANLRAPRQHTIFNLDGELGLAEVLSGRAGMEALATVESFVDLSLLPAGSAVPNSQELINRSGFVVMNDTLSERFDIILYDTPACASAADALTITARAGGVLLVVRKDHTRVADLTAFGDQVRRIGAEVVGTVLVSF
ncbi:MAG TPA: chain length determinant protein tyrosine kinase EpsG [Herbaspirillum sp.]|nr:chain length determinant protein tyrosine kinase EpsG [Herbaspirillum sp.]